MIQAVQAVNGANIPELGFGLYKIKNGEAFERTAENAIRCGYRHFDTAKIYGNEAALGRTILQSGIAREELYDEGRIKVIGVANFEIRHLEHLKKNSRITPMVNQIETHPEFQQTELHEYMVQNQILHEAWGPLGQGSKALLEHPELAAIAHSHRKSVAQVILRWHLERGIIEIPKSSNPQRMKENSEIFDFELNGEEMERIRRLDTGKRYSVSPSGLMVNPFYVKLMKLVIR